jgi:sarcosine oxidase
MAGHLLRRFSLQSRRLSTRLPSCPNAIRNDDIAAVQVAENPDVRRLDAPTPNERADVRTRDRVERIVPAFVAARGDRVRYRRTEQERRVCVRQGRQRRPIARPFGEHRGPGPGFLFVLEDALQREQPHVRGMGKNFERDRARIARPHVERFNDAGRTQGIDEPPGTTTVGKTPQIGRMRRGVRATEHRAQIALARPHAVRVAHDRRHIDADDAAAAEPRAHPAQNRRVLAYVGAHVEELPAVVERGQPRRIAFGPGEIQAQEAGRQAPDARLWGMPAPACERSGDERDRPLMYDAVVLGLGGMGSAALAHLARRGKRVLGLEQFARAHDLGASAGQSRIIRMAYYEDAAYVPLLRRAYELWAELERDAGAALLDRCGVLMVGGPRSRVLDGAARSARLHDIPVHELDRDQTLARYPHLLLRNAEHALFEPNAGMVFPEAAIEAHLRIAVTAGAQVRFETPVRGYVSETAAVAVELADGSTIRTRRLAICAGPWLMRATAELALPLRVQRNVQVWFEPASGAYARGRFPAFFLDREGAASVLYGFPNRGAGVKAALHGYGESTSPERLDRSVRDTDVAPVKAALDAFLPGAAGSVRAGKVCMYTLTPDEHFILDLHPRDARIVLAGGFSGHGYKFCPVIGEIVADLALEGGTRHPIAFLRLGRFDRA